MRIAAAGARSSVHARRQNDQTGQSSRQTTSEESVHK